MCVQFPVFSGQLNHVGKNTKNTEGQHKKALDILWAKSYLSQKALYGKA